MTTTPLKYAATRNGWAIALVQGTYRTGGTYYEVRRVSPQYREITLHSVADYQAARQLANREWLADKAA